MGWKNPFDFIDDIKDTALDFIYSRGESAVGAIPDPVREELGERGRAEEKICTGFLHRRRRVLRTSRRCRADPALHVPYGP